MLETTLSLWRIGVFREHEIVVKKTSVVQRDGTISSLSQFELWTWNLLPETLLGFSEVVNMNGAGELKTTTRFLSSRCSRKRAKATTSTTTTTTMMMTTTGMTTTTHGEISSGCCRCCPWLVEKRIWPKLFPRNFLARSITTASRDRWNESHETLKKLFLPDEHHKEKPRRWIQISFEFLTLKFSSAKIEEGVGGA